MVSIFLLGDKQYLLPRPDVVLAVFGNAGTATDIGTALLNTAAVALTGLAIAIVIGVLWAIAMSQARWVERSLFPYAVILQSIPILAVVPLIGFEFGYDFFARTIVCVLIALFPMVSNTLFGLQSVDQSQRELFTLQGASRWTILTKLEFPSALPGDLRRHAHLRRTRGRRCDRRRLLLPARHTRHRRAASASTGPGCSRPNCSRRSSWRHSSVS